MLVIRLSRTGRNKTPHYRLVLADKRAAANGRHIEVLGHYNPRTKELVVKEEQTKLRLEQGAQPSETAAALLDRAGVLKREAITDKNRRPTRKPRKEQPEEAAAPEAAAADTAAENAEAEAVVEEGVTSGTADETAAEATEEAPAAEEPAAETPAEEAPAEEPVAEETAAADDNDSENAS